LPGEDHAAAEPHKSKPDERRDGGRGGAEEEEDQSRRRGDPICSQRSSQSIYGVQLTFERADLADPEAFRGEFVLSGFGVPLPLKIMCSGAWFDFVDIDASKKRVFDTVASILPPGVGILCVGDNGNRAGNDHDLLGHPLGLSVGNVCGRPLVGRSLYGETCTGPAALRKILGSLKCASPGV